MRRRPGPVARRLRRLLLALAERVLAAAGFPTNRSGNNASTR